MRVVLGIPSVLVFTLQMLHAQTPLHIDYETARSHELRPHRRTVPLQGVSQGFNQLLLTLQVSATGDVLQSTASGPDGVLTFWPSLQSEVAQWKFRPFQVEGISVPAEVEEYIDLVPPERLPKVHVQPPAIRPDSTIAVTLTRSGCYGWCPSYSVALTGMGLTFDGVGFTVAGGKHIARVDKDAVRKLAERMVAADFYSFGPEYVASVTDSATYTLSLSVDGHEKKVVDYVGAWAGMPAVLTDLEDAVDEVAQSGRWVNGESGLVAALQAEQYDFKTFAAQVTLKGAIAHGQLATVQDLLHAGVPLTPLLSAKSTADNERAQYEHEGWLTLSASHREILTLMMQAGAGSNDAKDKALALRIAAREGDVTAFRALVEYGADPRADLHNLTVTERAATTEMQGSGSGSYLFEAASSGNPEMVREVLQYSPPLEVRDRRGQTALFAAVEYRSSDREGARAECVRMLVKAGAKVNADDSEGNTPLHEIFQADVAEVLLELGADVNARNNDGETPLFTTVDVSAVPLFAAHGADLHLRNKDGKTALDTATNPAKKEAIVNALAKSAR